MENVDDTLQLVRTGAQLIEGNGRNAAPREQGIGFREIARQLDVIAHRVVLLGRKEVQAVVAAAGRARELLYRQELDRVHAQVAQIVDAVQKIQVLADTPPLVAALPV